MPHERVCLRQWSLHSGALPVSFSSLAVPNNSHQIKCFSKYKKNKNTVCVNLLLSCDRVNDCGDGSDEIGCMYGTCSSQQFTCQNGVCIPSTYVCDGYTDCQDGSDELEGLCMSPEPTCAPGDFMCNSGECIDIHKVCNQQRDCSDNSDEKGCGKTPLCILEKA